MSELSPLMQQYKQVKEQYSDAIVFFRVGDFYEMFFDDAVTASRELELTLTGKDCGLPERAPMCGVPFHAYESYAARLIAKGYKVAVCEQTEDPSKTKKLVRREVIRVITPGTVMEQSMLDEGSNNFICSVFTQKNCTGAAFCDVSTGELFATLINEKDAESSIKDELLKFSPRELLIGGDTVRFTGLAAFIKDKLSACVNMLDDEDFSYASGCKSISEHFGKQPDELGLSDMPQTVGALGALITYLEKTQKTGLERLRNIEVYSGEQYMQLDYNTRRNLELTEPLTSKNKSASLLATIDYTKTSMGKRLIKSYIEKPLMSLSAITRRQNAVAELFDDVQLRGELQESLTGMFDIQRVITRIVYGSANARELRSLCAALDRLPAVKSSVRNVSSTMLRNCCDRIDTLEDIATLIDKTIVSDPPFSVREGGLINPGISRELDELRHDMDHSSELMAGIEARERERTGIPKLKIGYNRVFGYYIEVSNSYKQLVPETYIRKQTLTGGERYITEELKNLERRILGAKDRVCEIEYAMFETVRTKVAAAVDRISVSASAVAALDVLASLAQAAFENDYCCPALNTRGMIQIKDGRHPVVERIVKDTRFVPNDTLLDMKDNRVAIITGPNMSGKSTYMRQNALIILMAQIGSFVPAKSADLPIVDRIFTRIGASDDLATGQSTFMVEMNEVANILSNATRDSLLILDEIGRGTSTYDGMSIARAVLEYVADTKKLGAKTLFATHYHELTVLEDKLPGVKNYNIAAIKRGDDITFLRRIIPGAADDSYGVEVAKLAGLPDSVIERAKKILAGLEGSAPKKEKKVSVSDEPQLLLMPEETPIEKRLRGLDINKLTPMESMNILFELIKMLP